MNNNVWREELAWAAGFFDGEGSFLLDRRKWARISINQIDPEVLERFNRATKNLGKVNGPYNNPGRQPIYNYQATGSYKSQAVAAMLYPFLGTVKREQAARMLKQMRRSKFVETFNCPVDIEHLSCKHGHPYKGNRTKYGQCRECMRVADRKRRPPKVKSIP